MKLAFHPIALLVICGGMGSLMAYALSVRYDITELAWIGILCSFAFTAAVLVAKHFIIDKAADDGDGYPNDNRS